MPDRTCRLVAFCPRRAFRARQPRKPVGPNAVDPERDPILTYARVSNGRKAFALDDGWRGQRPSAKSPAERRRS